MIIEPIQFVNTPGQRLAGKIYRENTPSTMGVIFCHGLFSTKDGYKITRLADSIVSAGFTLMTFDFSFAGESEGDISNLSILQEVDDLRCAIDFFTVFGINRLHLMGSSFGGAVSVLYAARPHRTVESLITIATPVDLAGLVSEMGITDIDSLPDDGITVVQGITLNNRFFKEIKQVDMIEAVRKITIPVLIIHGEGDSVVSVDNAESIHEECPSFTKQVIIKDGDHNLTEKRFLEALELSIVNWLTSQS